MATKKPLPSQSLPKFSPKKVPSPEDLKLFRSAVAQLKKQGLIKSSVDARSARPYFYRGGKSLAEIVNKNSSKVTLAPSSATKPIAKKSAPAEPLPPKTKLAPLKKPLSIRDFPAKGRTLATVFNEMLRDPAKFDAMKRADEMWAFRIEGTDSRNLFASVDLMIDDAFKYGEGKGPYGNRDVFHSRSRSSNLYDKIQLIRWSGSVTEWKNQRHIKKGKKKSKAGKRAKQRRKR